MVGADLVGVVVGEREAQVEIMEHVDSWQWAVVHADVAAGRLVVAATDVYADGFSG